MNLSLTNYFPYPGTSVLMKLHLTSLPPSTINLTQKCLKVTYNDSISPSRILNFFPIILQTEDLTNEKLNNLLTANNCTSLTIDVVRCLIPQLENDTELYLSFFNLVCFYFFTFTVNVNDIFSFWISRTLSQFAGAPL